MVTILAGRVVAELSGHSLRAEAAPTLSSQVRSRGYSPHLLRATEG